MLTDLFRRLFVVIVSVVLMTGAHGAARTQAAFQPEQQGTGRLFLPLVSGQPSYSISGKIVDYLGNSLQDITVTLSNGQTTRSDSQGNYIFRNLPAGSYTYSASGFGMTFTPTQRSATLPPDLSGKNFTSEATSPVYLNMGPYFHSQRNETDFANACGPTSLLIVLDYFGITSGPLDNVIFATASIPPENGGFDQTCYANPVCLSAGVLNYVAQTTYKLSANSYEGWTFEQVYATLAQGRPVIALVTYFLTPGAAGHFVVVYGADPAARTITYHDPYSGPANTVSWSSFYAAWKGPVDVYDPLKPSGHIAWGMSLMK